ncbi:DNA-packaging protein [Zavarzinia sp. CC-PAN008]|uniref:DNA-packaging protein n=1 Tax=Zavarzinia sp. CC-PAN008 TaxID=3243332 RepID=UPI003F742D81
MRKDFLAGLTRTDRHRLLFDWRFWARQKQLAPQGDWPGWLVLAGRGFGKTRMGAEWVRAMAESGRFRRIALVGATEADVRKVMVEGESGLLDISPPWNRPRWEPSLGRLRWKNGVVAQAYSAAAADQLRGPQHDAAWADEVAKWADPDAWDQLLLGLRLGTAPRWIATTTPRPNDLVRRLLREAGEVTKGSTFENTALPPTFLEAMVGRYEGTRLGRQELHAEVLDDVPGALWTRAMIDDHRRAAPELARVVVAIDPSVAAQGDGAETGIVVAGIGHDGHGYVLADLSTHASPQQWAARAVEAWHRHEADTLVAETNQGGALVRDVLRSGDHTVPLAEVRASRSKAARAQPVSALYEQGRVHHVGALPELEAQLLRFTQAGPDGPCDRADALVWAITHLMLGKPEPSPRIRAL